MSNKISKTAITLLSGIIISGAVAKPIHINAMVNNEIVTNEVSNNSRAIKTGVVNASSLNVRSAAGTSFSKIGSLIKGATVQIEESTSNGWYKIRYGTTYGYVSQQYISVNSSSDSNSSNSSGTLTTTHTGIVNATSLNVRSGSSTSNSVIGKVTSGTKVEIVDIMSNGWSKIKYKTSYGYVSTAYLVNVVPVASSGGSTSGGSSSDVTVIKTGKVNATSLNVRNGSSTNSTKIGTLVKNAKVEVVNIESNGWYKIKYNSGFGYVSNLYIIIDGEENNSNQRTNLNNFLFVGDSFTYLLQNTIKANNSNVYVQAKSGSMPSYWLDKVASMPSNSSVDGVVLLIGVNGAGYESNKTDTKALINKLSAKYPNKTIYVQKVFPVGRNFTSATPSTFNSKIASLNSVIEAHCKTVSNAKFINTTSGFVDSSGYLLNTYDGLHISSSYNNQFYNNILNAVKNAEK